MYSIYCLYDGTEFTTCSSSTLVCICKSAHTAFVVFNNLVAFNTNKRLFYKVVKSKKSSGFDRN